MTGYLIDSDWVIDYLAGRRFAVALVDRLIKEDVSISIISIAELLDGAARTSDPAEAISRLRAVLAPFETVGLDFETAVIFGTLRSSLERAGMRLADLDLFIAATALRHDLTLVTRNRRHFDRVPGLWLHEVDAISKTRRESPIKAHLYRCASRSSSAQRRTRRRWISRDSR